MSNSESSNIDKIETPEKIIDIVGRRDPLGQKPGIYEDGKFIEDLPETPFWEGDKVKVKDKSFKFEDYPKDIFIIRIDYKSLGKNAKYPAYCISPDFYAGSSFTNRSEDELELVERGNVWKFHHGQPLEFKDVGEEAAFFYMQGQAEQVKNPDGEYIWSKEAVMEAIKKGIVDGFQPAKFGDGFIALCFKDSNLGKRLSTAIIEEDKKFKKQQSNSQ